MTAGSVAFLSPLQSGDYHVFQDGRVLMSGVHVLEDTVRGFTGQHRLVWISSEGHLDTTRIHRKGNGAIRRFVELENGKFIASGTSTQFAGQPVDRIFRFEADGNADTTYHTNISWGEAYDLLPLADGSVYAGGRYLHADALEDTIYVARFLPNGELDPAFAIPDFALGDLPDPGWDFGPLVFGVDTIAGGYVVVTGYFQFVNGQERRGICLLNSNGELLDAFGGCGVFPYLYQPNPNLTISYGELRGIVPYGEDHYLVWGGYHGYSDGVTTDMEQRMVTRLHKGDFTTGMSSAPTQPSFTLFPNPSTGNITVQLEQLPRDAQLVVRDALGREVQRQRVSDHYTTVSIVRSGVYVLELWDANGHIATGRVVVE